MILRTRAISNSRLGLSTVWVVQISQEEQSKTPWVFSAPASWSKLVWCHRLHWFTMHYISYYIIRTHSPMWAGQWTIWGRPRPPQSLPGLESRRPQSLQEAGRVWRETEKRRDEGSEKRWLPLISYSHDSTKTLDEMWFFSFPYHSNRTVNRITFHCVSGSSFCFLKKLGNEKRRRETEMEGRYNQMLHHNTTQWEGNLLSS